jgi:hypothetical protein
MWSGMLTARWSWTVLDHAMTVPMVTNGQLTCGKTLLGDCRRR